MKHPQLIDRQSVISMSFLVIVNVYEQVFDKQNSLFSRRYFSQEYVFAAFDSVAVVTTKT